MGGEVPSDNEIDDRAMAIFTRAIAELGGPQEVVRRGEQRLLPALMESAYILLLREEAGRSNREIAEVLGVSVGAVEAVFGAPMEAALARVRYRTDDAQEFDRHTDPAWSGAPDTPRGDMEYLAGALAKFAYDVVKRVGTPPT